MSKKRRYSVTFYELLITIPVQITRLIKIVILVPILLTNSFINKVPPMAKNWIIKTSRARVEADGPNSSAANEVDTVLTIWVPPLRIIYEKLARFNQIAILVCKVS